MRLEEEIKQTKPFQDEFQKLEVNLIYTYHWASNARGRAAERCGYYASTIQHLADFARAVSKPCYDYVAQRAYA